MSKKSIVLGLHKSGLSSRQIADRLGCCDGYVRATIQRDRHGGSRPSDLAAAKRQAVRRKFADLNMEDA